MTDIMRLSGGPFPLARANYRHLRAKKKQRLPIVGTENLMRVDDVMESSKLAE
jgi:hypothetical protein